MAITKIADVIVPELFNRYVINRTMELSAFFQSGIVVNSPEFDTLASEAARTHNMPFFEDLQGESEAILEDVKMTPKKIGSNKDVSTTILRQNMWGASNLSAALAGAAGVLYAHNLSTLTALPKNFGYNMSITVLVFVVLGGIGNIRGSIIAAVVLTLLPELLRFLSDYRMLIYAVVLIVTMILVWSPGGIAFREKLGTLSIFKKKEKEVQ